MNKRALMLLNAAALLAAGVGTPVPNIFAGAPRRRPRETIDDVLARARQRRPAFDLSLDGRKQGPNGAER